MTDSTVVEVPVVNGFMPDPYGGTRAGFSVSAEINRQDGESGA
jgi:hypothetical protein